MKIQCDCGAKYAFDASPEMVRNPVTFACPECGMDLSGRINEEVRRQFGNITGPVALSVSAPPAQPHWRRRLPRHRPLPKSRAHSSSSVRTTANQHLPTGRCSIAGTGSPGGAYQRPGRCAHSAHAQAGVNSGSCGAHQPAPNRRTNTAPSGFNYPGRSCARTTASRSGHHASAPGSARPGSIESQHVARGGRAGSR
ncbi:MAG: hypothetical protein U1F83_04000 [Verrucomicrobiota bacterium]